MSATDWAMYTTAHCVHEPQTLAGRGARPRWPARMAFALLYPLQVIRRWSQRARARRQLADLPDHLRRDIGLTDEQIAREAGKPFWRE